MKSKKARPDPSAGRTVRGRRSKAAAAGLYNKSACERMVPFDMKKAGLLCKWLVRDVWRQEDVGVFAGVYEASVPGHATHLVRLRPCRCGRLRDDVVDVRDAAWRLLREKDLALRGA